MARPTGVVHFGIDSMRPGPMGDVNLMVHKACLDLDITHIESLCNLEALLGHKEGSHFAAALSPLANE